MPSGRQQREGLTGEEIAKAKARAEKEQKRRASHKRIVQRIEKCITDAGFQNPKGGKWKQEDIVNANLQLMLRMHNNNRRLSDQLERLRTRTARAPDVSVIRDHPIIDYGTTMNLPFLAQAEVPANNNDMMVVDPQFPPEAEVPANVEVLTFLDHQLPMQASLPANTDVVTFFDHQVPLQANLPANADSMTTIDPQLTLQANLPAVNDNMAFSNPQQALQAAALANAAAINEPDILPDVGQVQVFETTIDPQPNSNMSTPQQQFSAQDDDLFESFEENGEPLFRVKPTDRQDSMGSSLITHETQRSPQEPSKETTPITSDDQASDFDSVRASPNSTVFHHDNANVPSGEQLPDDNGCTK